MNAREAAFRALQQVELENSFADLAIPPNLSPQLHNDARTIVFAVLRWRSRLDALISQLSGRRVQKIDQPLLQILRMAFVEVLFLSTPAHAAVNEAVTMAGRLFPRGKGFVNAVLRKISGGDLDSLEKGSTASPATRAGHPDWLVERWIARFGVERALSIAAANQELSRPDVLVNITRTTTEEMEASLTERRVSAQRSELVSNMLRLRSSSDEVRLDVEGGLLYPMDEGSAAVATLIPAECRSVLDLAAAPGGKSLHLMMRGHDVTSHDISLRRMQPLRESALRMFGRRPRLVIADGTRPPFRRRHDAVLIDVPCSATGTIRRNPEIKWRLQPAQLGVFQTLQIALLEAALELTDRFCLYSTCSLEREENEDVIEKVLRRNDSFEQIDLAEVAEGELSRWIEGGSLRLTPESGADGFTAFGLRRRK
ncbi:MAG TPA: transcription antitermination factor NusB [Thermoanaerobaculia bacterium]|nr:transcription antitermination factor NusB [Thermoanaerobaculia bacterium]